MINKGDLPIDIRWTLNSEPIVANENSFTMMKMNSRTSSLNIEYLNAQHRGVYKCVASNNAGEAEFSTQLFVNGGPSSCLHDLFRVISI